MSMLSVNFIILILFSTLTLIKSGKVNFQFISATSKFKYAIIQEDSDRIVEHMVNLSDKFLMVGVAPNLFLGPAHLRYRLVESPFEQIITVTKFEYSPIKDSVVQKTLMKDDEEFMYSCPNFGFLTSTNNFLFKKLEAEEYFDPEEYPEVKIVKGFKVKPGDSLAAVTLFKGKMGFRMVKVLKFGRCEHIFDPERFHHLNRNEQICTEDVDGRRSRYPLTLPSTLLFGKDEEHGYVLVGITSRTRAGVSLSTFVPYHCDEIFEAFKQELCV